MVGVLGIPGRCWLTRLIWLDVDLSTSAKVPNSRSWGSIFVLPRLNFDVFFPCSKPKGFNPCSSDFDCLWRISFSAKEDVSFLWARKVRKWGKLKRVTQTATDELRTDWLGDGWWPYPEHIPFPTCWCFRNPLITSCVWRMSHLFNRVLIDKRWLFGISSINIKIYTDILTWLLSDHQQFHFFFFFFSHVRSMKITSAGGHFSWDLFWGKLKQCKHVVTLRYFPYNTLLRVIMVQWKMGVSPIVDTFQNMTPFSTEPWE